MKTLSVSMPYAAKSDAAASVIHVRDSASRPFAISLAGPILHAAENGCSSVASGCFAGSANGACPADA